MEIRKITFDNGNIVLAKDQAILYDLLLKQQTKTLLPNGKNIYQNSTGFLIQNESEKLKYTYKITNNGIEFTFNPQLYLSVCGRIIKLEKDTKYLFDWNDIENNETYYVVVKIDLSKEAKIINSELKEFGNPVEVKLINTKEKLTQNNLNKKPSDGIYEFPLISFIKKYNIDNSWEIKTKDESTYLLTLLMQSSRKPPKLLTITQKIQEEIENVENYLTDLKYRKMEELNELENLMQELIKIPKNERPKIPENSNWKLVVGDFWEEVKQSSDDKWYIAIYWRYGKTDDDIYWTIDKFNNIKKIKMNYYDKVYRWDGDGEPKLPIINPNTGKITDWK